jgi:hypothetical protein
VKYWIDCKTIIFLQIDPLYHLVVFTSGYYAELMQVILRVISEKCLFHGGHVNCVTECTHFQLYLSVVCVLFSPKSGLLTFSRCFTQSSSYLKSLQQQTDKTRGNKSYRAFSGEKVSSIR